MSDPVNHPSHYTYGKFEVIDVIEDAVVHAPGPRQAGLQWNILKYLLRMWHKGKPVQDAKKAQFYLNRLVEMLEATDKMK